MSITSAQLASLLEEINPRLAGGAVRQVWCRNPWCFILEIRQPGENRFLLFSIEEGAVRLHLVAGAGEQPPRPPDFIMLLRKHLAGAQVSTLEQAGSDRVARLRFQPSGSQPRPPSLIAELTGRHGNVFLLDGDNTILGSLLPNHSYRRKLVAGEIYQHPAPLDEAAGAWTQEDPLMLGAQPSDGSRSQSLDRFYDRVIREQAVLAEALDLLRRLREEEKNKGRKAAAIARDLERAAGADRYRRWGELLQSAYGREVRGAESIEVPDYYEPGMPMVSIPLENTLDLQGNIGRYFNLYRKFQNARGQIQERLEKVREKHAAAASAFEEARALAWAATEGKAGDPPPGPEEGRPAFLEPEEGARRLEAFRVRVESENILRKKPAPPAPAGKAREAPALPYRQFTSKSGRAILVGKSGKENDQLTLRIARGNDIWLHAHDWAGSHVVARMERDESIDEESLLDAATLAAFYSKGKNDTSVEVLYTQAKHVRKPKGFPPGRVSVAASKTILIRIEKVRLDRLFNAGGA